MFKDVFKDIFDVWILRDVIRCFVGVFSGVYLLKLLQIDSKLTHPMYLTKYISISFDTLNKQYKYGWIFVETITFLQNFHFSHSHAITIEDCCQLRHDSLNVVRVLWNNFKIQVEEKLERMLLTRMFFILIDFKNHIFLFSSQTDFLDPIFLWFQFEQLGLKSSNSLY